MHVVKRRGLFSVIGILFFGVGSTTLLAQPLTFSLKFEDVVQSTGVGFDDPVSGASRRAQLSTVASQIGPYLNHPGGNVSVNVLSSETDGTGVPVLGQACHDLSPFGVFFEPYSLQAAEFVIAPFCDDGGHMTIAIDFGFQFDYDPANGTAGWDFDSATKQGLIHGMGYGSNGVVAGPPPYGGSSSGQAISFSRMTDFLFFDEDGISRVWDWSGPYNGDPLVPLADGDVFFNDGPFGNSFPLALGGEDSFMYSGVSTDLMSPLTPGVAQSRLRHNDLAALAAVGWDVQFGVPEPSSGGSAMIGVLFLFGMMRRGKRLPRASSPIS